MIKRIIVGQLQANCYCVFNENTLDAFLVDPGDDYKKINRFIKDKELKLKGIFLTHGHIDHIQATQAFLVGQPKLPVYIHHEDASFLSDASKNLSNSFMRMNFILKPENLILLEDEMKIEIADKTVTCKHYPGHTPGSSAFIIEEECIMFSGDILFSKSIGRFDLPYGNRSDTINTLKKIKLLTTNYTIYPGHDEKTTLFEELQQNPYLLQI